MADTRLLTVGQVATHFGVSFAAVNYALRSRGVTPAMRAGVMRMYWPEQLPDIRAALEDTGALPPAELAGVGAGMAA